MSKTRNMERVNCAFWICLNVQYISILWVSSLVSCQQVISFHESIMESRGLAFHLLLSVQKVQEEKC